MTALQMAPEPVLLLSKAPLGAQASSLWAQGGLAAAMDGDDDPALHLADTLAARARADVPDLESVQFDPRAVDGPSGAMRLVTEAVRGDDATLIDDTGQRFMADQPGAEVAPRDIGALGVWRRRAEGHRVFLDSR